MSDCLILYILHHKGCIAGAYSTHLMSGEYTHIFILHATGQNTIVQYVWTFKAKLTTESRARDV